MHRKRFNKYIQRPALTALIMACCLGSLHARVVATNMTALLGSVTPLPATAQEAFGKCVETGDNLEVMDTIRSFRDELEALIRENTAPPPMENVILPKVTGRTGKKPDAKKKSPAAKPRNKTVSGGTPQAMDPPALEECAGLSNELAEVAGDTAFTDKLANLQKRYNAEHESIQSQIEKALKDCPGITKDEKSPYHSRCVRGVQNIGADRHINAATRELGELRVLCAARTALLRPLVNRADALLARVKFGAGMDTRTSQPCVLMQGLVLKHIMTLQALSMQSLVNTAQWVRNKKNIGK